MGFKTNHIQIDGSLNVDGSIFQWNELFEGGGGGDVSMGGITDVSFGPFLSDGDMLEYISSGDYWTQRAAPADFRNLGMMDPIHFPFIDGEFTIDTSITSTGDGSTNIKITISPDDTDYTLFYGYSAGAYRTKTINTNRFVYHKLYLSDDPSRYEVLTIYSRYDGGDGETSSSGQPSTDLGSTDCILATVKFRNYGNADGEILETINWSKLNLNASASSGGGGDVSWANGNVGTNNWIVTSGGDGSIWSENWLIGDFTTKILSVIGDVSVNGQVNAADGFETGNFAIVHNATSDTLDFNYIG